MKPATLILGAILLTTGGADATSVNGPDLPAYAVVSQPCH